MAAHVLICSPMSPHQHKESAEKRDPVISVKNVSFAYQSGIPILNDINFDVYARDFIGLIGPNGGGKSTLLKLIVGILPLQKGTIQLFGETLQEFRRWSYIGYVSQSVAHFDRRFPATVAEVVAMGRTPGKSFFSKLTNEDKAMVDQSLEDVDMLKYKNTPIHQLSGGQQQRVFIARALAGNPCLLALDEPTIGIDVHAQEQFYTLLQKLRKEKGITVILVSHDIDVVVNQVNSVACLNQTLIYHGVPEGLKNQEYFERLYGKDIRLILHNH